MVRGTAHRRAGRYTRAIADLDKAIKLDPHLADAYTQRAFALQQSDKPDVSQQILADVNRAIEINSTNALSFIIRGNQYAYFGEAEAAPH